MFLKHTSKTFYYMCEVVNTRFHFCFLLYTVYKAAVSLCVCGRACVRACGACLSVSLFFQHDRRTATKFGTHMRIDLGIIRI